MATEWEPREYVMRAGISTRPVRIAGQSHITRLSESFLQQAVPVERVVDDESEIGHAFQRYRRGLDAAPPLSPKARRRPPSPLLVRRSAGERPPGSKIGGNMSE